MAKHNYVRSPETKTLLRRIVNNVALINVGDNNKAESMSVICPAIVDVRVFNDTEGNPCATYVDFADGTSTSAARRDNDIFNVEHGISICITKKLLDMSTHGAGHQAYNKLIRYAYKVKNERDEAKKRIKEEEKAAIRRTEKLAEKKRRRDERRNAKEREQIIEIQKEAILRALKEYDEHINDLAQQTIGCMIREYMGENTHKSEE